MWGIKRRRGPVPLLCGGTLRRGLWDTALPLIKPPSLEIDERKKTDLLDMEGTGGRESPSSKVPPHSRGTALVASLHGSLTGRNSNT